MSSPNLAIYNTPELVHEGLSFWFNRDSVGVANSSGGIVTHTYGWQGLGSIEERTDKVNLDAETIYDDSSGKSRPIVVVQNGYEQVYELTTPNVAMPLREIYLNSLPPIVPTAYPGGTITAAPINLYPGQPAKIMNANGSNGALAVTSVTSITVASTPLVLGVDWAATADMLAAGFIQILPTSTVVPSTTPGPVAATITYVANQVTGAVTLKPGSGPCCVQGQGELHMVTCGKLAYVDRGYFAITIPEMTRDAKKSSRMKVTATRLYDPTGVYADEFTWYK